MKNIFPVLLLLVAGICVGESVSSLEIYQTIPVGSGSNEIAYNLDELSNWSPRTFDFVDGRRIWIAGTNNVKIYDIYKKNIVGVVSSPKFRSIDRYGDIANAELFAFDGPYFVASSGGDLVFGKFDLSNQLINSFHRQDSVRPDSAFFLSDGKFYFYDEEGLVRCVQDEGPAMDNPGTIAILTKALEKTWYSDENRKKKHRALIQTGRYLITNGVFLPKDYRNLQDYFSTFAVHWDYPDLVQANPQVNPIVNGVSLAGDIYLSFSRDTLVYNQIGEHIGTIHDPGVYPELSDPRREKRDVSPPFISVNSNGDFYFSYAVNRDKMYIYTAKNSWGTDYVSLAKNGIRNEESEKIKSTLQGFNNLELRILRNAFFSLQGYDLQSWDLKTYFNGYDWYQPIPDVKADPATLNANQKRLFSLVLAEEARRK